MSRRFPLSRYVGAWTYPTVGAHFHGAQPLSAELVVTRRKRARRGKFDRALQTAPGNTGDPVVQFNFDGALQELPRHRPSP